MRYPKNISEKLEASLFRNPTAEYRGIPFWSWNCKLTKEKIDWQLDCFQKMGFGGVDIHPRTGLDTEYLGEEYMELTRYAVERCKEKGLICWLYDDDRFPSGSAGGKATKNIRFCGRYLLLTKQRKGAEDLPVFCGNKKSFEEALEAGAKPGGYFAAAYCISLHDGRLKSYIRIQNEEEAQKLLDAGENVWFAYVKIMEKETWFEDSPYVDTMNPEAVREFIKTVYEAFDRTAGEEFGKGIPAIFTDEPRMGKHSPIFTGESCGDVTIPYTEYLDEQMQKRFGVSPLEIAPEYIWELEDNSRSVRRYQYREAAAECFVSAFMDQIADWCKGHGIAMTGHVLSEETLYAQTFALGDCMRCYRKMDLPGIDILADFREFMTVKQAVSVARQNGREGTVSELYGVTQWDCSFKTYKLQGDWQAALGITIRVPHLSHMSLKGEAKRDWPGSVFFQSPWYEEFPLIENHFARLNTALTRGKPAVKIAVLHPVESMWLYFGPNSETAGIREELDRTFRETVEWLLYGTLDFDFISEALLTGQYHRGSGEDSLLRAGEAGYSAVLVAGLCTIRSTTLEILEDFRKRGGKIIFMGEIPKLTDAKPSEGAKRLAAECTHIPREREMLYRALEEERELEIRKANGCRSDNLFYQMRKDNDCRWLFICHVNERKGAVSLPENYSVWIRGYWKLTAYDTMTGNITAVRSEFRNGKTLYSCELYGEDSILLKLEKSDGSEKRYKEAEKIYKREQVASLERPDMYLRTEPNVLLLDYAEVSADGGEFSEKEEILRADNRLRRRFGFMPREERMNQPWHLQEGEHHRVKARYEIDSEIETGAFLALEQPRSCTVWMNGEKAEMKAEGFYVDPDIPCIRLPGLRRGRNDLVLEMDYHQKSGLENLYVLGDFDVELGGVRAVIREKRKRITIGDITGQGMPFYTGNLDYIFNLQIKEEGVYSIHIPKFCAPLLGAAVDGERKGVIAYAPHRLSLGYLAKGKHVLAIRLFGNRFNGFGTLHNADENFVWYGPDAYRTEGDAWTDCYCIRPSGILCKVGLERIVG